MAAPNVRDQQITREAVITPPNRAIDQQVFREAIIVRKITGTITTTQAAQTLAVTAQEKLAATITTAQAAQQLNVAARIKLPQTDKPSIQFHPVLKPLDFAARPLTQPGKRLSGASSFLAFLTTPGANRSLSIPLGARNQPLTGKLFAFSMGGTVTLGSAGTLVITPFYGADVSGVNLGQSLPNAYSGNTDPLAWRLQGQIIFQNVTFEPGLSNVLCGGVFTMNTTPATVILFGSSNPIQVDASMIKRTASGALNFAATFAPFSLNASAPSITTRYAVLRAI